jgi:VWFA-related protein
MTNMRNRISLWMALGGLAAGLVAVAHPAVSRPRPQDTAAPPGPQQPAQAAAPNASAPVMRKTTRLVQVTVVAHHKGAPVADLTQDDFHVFDNGQEQTIAFFSKETGHVLDEPASPLPKDTWSNRTETRKGIPINVTMILYDGLNTRVMDQNLAREQIVRFLSQLHPEDRVALYSLGKNLRVLHDFTSDASALLSVLSKYKGYSGPEIRASEPENGSEQDFSLTDGLDAVAGGAAVAQFLDHADDAYAQFQTVARAQMTVDALEAIATHVAGIPGRKNLIWVSGGFPFTMGFDNLMAGLAANPLLQNRDFSAEVQRAARALTDANIAVYPVDAHGLVVSMGNMKQMTQTYRRGYTNMAPPLSQQDLNIQTMDTLADRTGGRAFYRTNDLSGAIRSAIEDSQVTYSLAFAPTHNDWNGKFRAIKVTTKRPGTELRYRMGYFAMPDKELEPTQSQQMAYEAQWSTLEATEIGLTVQAVRTTLESKPVVNFKLVVDSAGVRFTEAEGRHTTNLLMILAQRAGDGRVLNGDSKTLALKLKDDTYQKVMMKGLSLGGTLVLEPAAAQLRWVILDQSTGQLGSVDVPVARLTNVPAAPAAPAPPGATPPAPPAPR